MTKSSRRKFTGLLYLMPWMIGILVFVVYPFGTSLYYSFTDYSMLSEPNFVGLANYRKMFFDDPVFWTSLKATVKFVFLNVPLKMVFALFIAYIMNAKLKGIGFFGRPTISFRFRSECGHRSFVAIPFQKRWVNQHGFTSDWVKWSELVFQSDRSDVYVSHS